MPKMLNDGAVEYLNMKMVLLRQKPRYAITDMPKQFEVPEYSSSGDGLGEGQAGGGKLRVSVGQNKVAAKDAKAYAITDMPKQFGVPPESSLGDGLGEGQAGSGKLVVPVDEAAPNLCALVGEAVAAKLIGTAGGLTKLARIPGCNIQLLGASKESLAGFPVGHIGQTEMFQSTPPALNLRACRLIALKSTLAARLDSSGGYKTGGFGRELREEIHKKIEKWREPSPAKQPKPLPVPDSKNKKKEMYAITDMCKQFEVPEESSSGDGLGEGQAGGGKLRVSVGQNKVAAKDAKAYAITDMPKQFGVPPESSLGDGLGEGQAGSGKLVVPVDEAAPNLCALVGEAVAAKLIGTAGGLTKLARIPGCNIQLLGASKESLAGFPVGHIGQTEMFQSTPPALNLRACRLIALKSTLAARLDSSGGYKTGGFGRELREEIHKKIEKWREPSPAKQPKPLPVPDSKNKKKEMYAITDMCKQFEVPEESSSGDGLGEGQAGGGKLRVSVGQNKLAAKDAKAYAITDMPKQFEVPEESSLGDGLGEGQAGGGKLSVSVGQNKLAAKDAKAGVSSPIHRH